MNRSNDWPTNQPNQWTNQKPTNQPMNQWTNQLSDYPTNQTNKLTKKPTKPITHPPTHLSEYKAQHPFCRPSSSTASHITFMLQNPTLYHHTEHNPPTAPVLSQTNPVPAVPAYTVQSIVSIILTTMHRYSKWSLSSAFSYQNPTGTISLPRGRYSACLCNNNTLHLLVAA